MLLTVACQATLKEMELVKGIYINRVKSVGPNKSPLYNVAVYISLHKKYKYKM